MKHKRLKFAAAATVAALILLIGASLAYFTDNTQGTATGTAGTVKISLDDTSFDLDNPVDKIDNFNPGDGRVVNATITNEGNKSVDIRQTYVITMKPTAPATAFTALPSDGTTPMGWALYDVGDCDEDKTTGNYTVKAGKTPIVPTITWAKNADNISWSASFVAPTDIVLDGTGQDAEIEAAANGKTDYSGGYVLVFLPASDNSYQAAKVTLDLLVEAKQHRNTSDIVWSTLGTQSVTFGGGTVKVVPDAATQGNGSTAVA